MMEESNPVKEYLFNYIKSESSITKLLDEGKFSSIIDIILQKCYDKITSIGNKNESLAVMATGILHYLLTNALIPSQRKVKKNGIEVDIVIPDLKTLENDPEKTLIIHIPKHSNKDSILQEIKNLQEIQPIQQNIWIVLTEKISLDFKTYYVSKYESTFSKIIYDIGNFTNVNNNNKFKILRI
ncbi:MAG: hypothetical protein R3327_02750 [Nitrosopumilaceae archaeon]|nr:hypothetical protein [Nitrosopumilaceae archaeon]